jgi:FkbM family methyltransferase
VHPGDVVWDIGGNIGLFTFSAAYLAGPKGHVITVEADTWNVSLLRRSAHLQGSAAANVDVIPAAVSDRIGFATFNIASRNRSTNALEGFGSTQTGGFRESQTVPTISLNTLAEHFPLPRVLKIDIEGAEALALATADKVLKHRPIVICEVSKHNAIAVRDLLLSYGYSLFDADATPPRHPVGEIVSFNILAIAKPIPLEDVPSSGGAHDILGDRH